MAISPERLAQLRKELWGPRHQELIDEIDQLTRKLAEAKAMLRYVDIAAKTRKETDHAHKQARPGHNKNRHTDGLS